jgi:alpha-amylase/alpha-mannosidase (GH57 family)
MTRANVAFLWHMHQPDYGLPGQNLNLLPWVRLHATKSYYDLPWMLQRHPDVRAVINLSGSLLKQLRGYTHRGLSDVWRDISRKHPSELDDAGRQFLVRNFFSIHWDRHVRPVPAYDQLRRKRGPSAPYTSGVWSDRELLDLQVLFNLAWMGFAAREESEVVRGLIHKGSHFSDADKHALVEEQDRITALVLPLYQSLARTGQIELTTTPLYHPILPLIVDTDAARRSAPSRPLPQRFAWPQDAQWHVEAAAIQFEEIFGVRPRGMWPAEGSVSPEVVPIFANAGIEWIASDEEVLFRSTPRPSSQKDALYRAYSTGQEGAQVNIIFRDHEISDLIGFAYAQQNPADAAADLIDRLRACGSKTPVEDPPLVSVILDGENPWEAYQNDGRPFLESLFSGLAAADDLDTVVVADHLARRPPKDSLDHLHSGSWIMANYQIWIGAKETNRAWNLLTKTRLFLSGCQGDDGADLERAYAALYAAQGSDWFWWYGDDFQCGHKPEFDALFRAQLRAVYRACGASAPPELHEPIQATDEGGVDFIGPRALINPKLDGLASSFFSWAGAGAYEPRGGEGSMFRNSRYIESIHFGFSTDTLFVRIDPGHDLHEDDISTLEAHLIVRLSEKGQPGALWAIEIPLDAPETSTLRSLDTGLTRGSVTVVFGRVLEIAVPLADLAPSAGMALHLTVALLKDGAELLRLPSTSDIVLTVPDHTFELNHWLV